jgi:hypothetical protein
MRSFGEKYNHWGISAALVKVVGCSWKQYTRRAVGQPWAMVGAESPASACASLFPVDGESVNCPVARGAWAACVIAQSRGVSSRAAPRTAQVGTHPTSAAAVAEELGGATPPELQAAAIAAGVPLSSPCSPREPRGVPLSRTTSSGSAVGGPLTVMGLAAQLLAAAEAVSAAAAQLRMWSEEARDSVGAALGSMGAAPSEGPALVAA